MKALYAGSFDPITYGHLDIIKRACEIFDDLVIVIMENETKQAMFSENERVDMIKEVTKDLPNVTVMVGSGLTVDFARKIGAKVLVRGIRAVTDYENEMQLATTNMQLAEDIHTVFLTSRPQFSFLSSSTAKTIASFGEDVSAFVPDYVAKKLHEKYEEINNE